MVGTLTDTKAPAPLNERPGSWGADGEIASRSSSPPARVKASILVVDDRPEKLLALEATLSELGQEIVKANSGREALRCLLNQDFAVIVLDVSMPGMDGLETGSMIRMRSRSERTPIIFVTSYSTRETDIMRGYSLGAVDFLQSPIIPEVLKTKVSVFVELYKQTELIKRQAEQLQRLERLRHERELAEVTDRLEAETRRNRFFTLAIDLLGIADLDGRFLQVNPAWETSLGYASEELCSRSIVDLTHPEDRSGVQEVLGRLRREALPVSFEAHFQHSDGSYRCLSWSTATFQSEGLLYLFARDITARKESEEEIRRLNRELETRVSALTAANSELEAFNYSIAHDLRAPLRSMGGFAKALMLDEGSGLSAQGREFASRIVRSTIYMDALLQDLLDYSRMSRTQVVPEEIPLAPFVQETLTLFQEEISSKAGRVEVHPPLGTVYAHLPTLRRVLNNLVDNALKFHQPGKPPSVHIRSQPGPGVVRLSVQDDGIGIAPENHERVFGLFRRLHDSSTHPGTGIGLAIVRRGAAQMGGRAGVESQLGQGSTFWVELPAPPDSKP